VACGAIEFAFQTSSCAVKNSQTVRGSGAPGPVEKCSRPRFQAPVIMAETPGGRDGTCIACHCLPFVVLMPRQFSVSAVARVEKLCGFGDRHGQRGETLCTLPRLFLSVADEQEAKPSMQGVDYVIHSRPCGVLRVPLA